MTAEAVGRSTTPVAGAPRTLLGGYFRVESTREWIRAWVAALILLGPARLLLRLAAALPERGPAGIRSRTACRAAERWWARLAARLVGLRVDIRGLEHIKPGERYVVASLHEGFADSLALLRLPLSLTAVARDELATFPVLGPQLARGQHLLVRPERPLQGAHALLREAQAAIDDRDSVLLFPQGSILGIELAFQPGAFNLARRLGRPLLPVVVTGGHRVWEHPFAPTLRANQSMSVVVLPPVPAKDAVARQPAIEQDMKRLALASKTPPRHFDPSRDGYWDDYRYEIHPDFPDLSQRVANHRRDAAGAHTHGP